MTKLESLFTFMAVYEIHMRLPLYLFIVFQINLFAQVSSQPSERLNSRHEYVELYKEDAIKEMIRTGIPASITMAQAILESSDGNSPLAKYANNHFGIKCHDWKGATFIQDDDSKNECFRKYKDVYQSYEDHSNFLRDRPRYAFLFDLKPTDYIAWAHGLKKAGYATNPKYPQLLLKIIEENNLHELDKQEKIPSKNTSTKNPKHTVKPKTKTAESNYQIEKDELILKHENNVEYVVAKKDETPFIIAKKLHLGAWEINKYNDLEKNQSIHAGDIIFIKPKRKESKNHEIHTAQEGETLWSISQEYGIRLKKLAKMNDLSPEDLITKGQKIKLQK